MISVNCFLTMNSKKSQILPKKELFYKESIKVYVLVSDGIELLVYHTTNKPDSYNMHHLLGGRDFAKVIKDIIKGKYDS